MQTSRIWTCVSQRLIIIFLFIKVESFLVITFLLWLPTKTLRKHLVLQFKHWPFLWFFDWPFRRCQLKLIDSQLHKSSFKSDSIKEFLNAAKLSAIQCSAWDFKICQFSWVLRTAIKFLQQNLVQSMRCNASEGSYWRSVPYWLTF